MLVPTLSLVLDLVRAPSGLLFFLLEEREAVDDGARVGVRVSQHALVLRVADRDTAFEMAGADVEAACCVDGICG